MGAGRRLNGWLVLPAIDLRAGRCVRLRQGDPSAETVYGEDPVAVARHWVGLGAEALHVVDLDGAFQGAPAQLALLRRIVEAVDVPVQYGGGLRTAADVEAALAAGASRVVVGTALGDPARAEQLLSRWGPERLVAALDARGRRFASHGWRQASAADVVEVARAVRALGVRHALFTQVERDGTLQGPDWEGVGSLLDLGLGVIVSGGIRSADDIRRLAALRARGVEGVVVGQALYTGTLTLAEALAAARTAEGGGAGC